MGRDFAKKGRHKARASTERVNHWLWLLTGTAIGILISAIAVFKLFPVVYPVLTTASVEQTKEIAETKTQKSAPKFDFYSLLPELEVAVPQAPKPTIAQTPETIVTDTEYRLQLASFRNYKDADSLKAQMALTGIQVEIEAVTLAPDDTWYRVRTISYPNLESAESARAQLQAQSIQSLLLEEKG